MCEHQGDRGHTSFIFLFHSDYYHCFVVFFPLFSVGFISVWFVLSSSWDHSPRCHWPCLAELSEKDVETLRPLPHSWPSRWARGQAPQMGALQGVRLKVTITPNTVVQTKAKSLFYSLPLSIDANSFKRQG